MAEPTDKGDCIGGLGDKGKVVVNLVSKAKNPVTIAIPLDQRPLSGSGSCHKKKKSKEH